MNSLLNKKVIIGLIAALVIVLALFMLNRGSDEGDRADNISNESQELEAGEVRVDGEIACLQGEASEADCIKAIRGDDGKLYALNTIDVGAIENTMPIGAEVFAIGEFQPANTSVGESGGFSYDGVLVVRVLQRQ